MALVPTLLLFGDVLPLERNPAMRNSYLVVCSLAVWILVGITPNAMSQEKTQEKKKTGVAAYDDFKEPYRTQFIEKWKEAITAAKSRVKDLEQRLREAAIKGVYVGGSPGKADGYRVSTKSPAGRMEMQKIKEEIKEATNRVHQLVKNDPPFIPIPVSYLPYEPSDWRPGNSGVMGGNVKIIQVIGEDRMLILAEGIRFNSKRIVMLCGFLTSGRTDGEALYLNDPVEITGTTTYTAVNGGTNTVLEAVKMKPFDREAYIQSLKREKP